MYIVGKRPWIGQRMRCHKSCCHSLGYTVAVETMRWFPWKREMGANIKSVVFFKATARSCGSYMSTMQNNVESQRIVFTILLSNIYFLLSI